MVTTQIGDYRIMCDPYLGRTLIDRRVKGAYDGQGRFRPEHWRIVISERIKKLVLKRLEVPG